jgi:hypothetical protein
MGFSLAYWKRRLPLAAVAAVVMCSGPAQGAGPRPGQPIIFSSPDNSNVDSNNLPSLSPKPAESTDFRSALEAPSSFKLNNFSDSASLPPMGPAFSPNGAAQLQEMLDRRNNWMLLTPAEILGAATPEKILGIPEHDGFGQRKYPTALERYTERQNRMLLDKTTNALQAGNSYPAWNPFDDRNGMSNSISGRPDYPNGMANPLFDSTADKQSLGRQNENNGWSRLLGQSVQAPATKPAEVADMDRFRQLLSSGSSPDILAATPAAGGIKTSLPQTLLGSGLDPSRQAQVGASFTPLSSGISKPPGLPKLPSVWGQSYTSSPPAATWMPQQAPWLSPSPQPLAAPQRKF